MDDLVSVIVPVYNAEDCLGRCIKSITEQSYSNIEIILVDDGSTDNSSFICDAFSKEDERIRVVHKTNSGVSSARNCGLEMAKGEFIMFCDSDDFVSRFWVVQFVRIANKESVDFAVCSYKSFTGSDEIVPVDTDNSLQEYEIFEKSYSWELYKKLLLNAPWNKIFKKSIIDEYNIRFDENLSMGEDLKFNLEYLSHCSDKIAITNNKLYFYYSNQGSLSKKYIENYWNTKKDSFENLKRKMIEFGVDEDIINEDYYDMFFNGAVECLNNNLKSKNKSFLKKLKDNAVILKSKEFETALICCNKNKFNSRLIAILKLKNSFVYYFFNRILELKNRSK